MDFTFNKLLSEGYKNKAQIARVLTEDWISRNMYCPICGNLVLNHYEANRPVADFYCKECGNDFELKSKESSCHKFDNVINDGQYDRMIERITSEQNPNFFFMHYADYKVYNLILIPKHFFVPDIIVKRKPLSPMARRAGWVGCNIDIAGIPSEGKIFIVRKGKAINKQEVQQEYQKTLFLKRKNLQHRGWLLDILMCIERIQSVDFSLDQIYAFAPELQLKHPDNNFIRDKIRQQLQYLRDQGYIEFTSRGHYRKL